MREEIIWQIQVWKKRLQNIWVAFKIRWDSMSEKIELKKKTWVSNTYNHAQHFETMDV